MKLHVVTTVAWVDGVKHIYITQVFYNVGNFVLGIVGGLVFLAYVVGGFYRVHAERGVDENLNAPGASFVPLAFAESAHLPQPGIKPGASVPNRFYMYGVVGRLAMLAASYELEATDPEAEVYD